MNERIQLANPFFGLATSPARPAGELDIHPIKPPVPIPQVWFWLGVTAASLVAAALLVSLWRFWRKRRKKQPEPQAGPAIPPHLKAKAKMDEALGYLNEPRVFCILVSDALRNYLEERFDWRAPERTTEEFLDELQASALLDFEQKSALGALLMRCDLAKFAKFPHGPADLRELHATAWRLIEQTAPAEPERSVSGTT